ncbi:MAG: response regulator [Acidimicrobiia bacterium]|nr:response regulator [Acidimicrobiia bacterium]
MPSVLVVADEPWVLDDVRAALGEARYRITAADDPRTIAATALASRPDVVVVDFQVGSMGGMAVTRSVRDAFSRTNDPAPPVILLLDRDADGFLAGRSGAAGWVRKPFAAADLRQVIDEHTAPTAP